MCSFYVNSTHILNVCFRDGFTKYISCLFIYIQQQLHTSADNVAATASTATDGDHVAKVTP